MWILLHCEKAKNKFCYCRNRRRTLWRKHSILLEKWIKQYKLGRIGQATILNSPVVTSWRTESSNISLVVLDKLLYYSRNLVFFIFQNFLKTNRPTDIGTYRRLLSSKNQHYQRILHGKNITHNLLKCWNASNVSWEIKIWWATKNNWIIIKLIVEIFRMLLLK